MKDLTMMVEEVEIIEQRW